MTKLKYILAVIANVISTILPFAAIIGLIYMYAARTTLTHTVEGYILPVEERVSLAEAHPTLKIFMFIATFISIAQWLILKAVLKNKLNRAMLDNEYDENGVSKKKKFENLTRKEREAMDLQKASIMESLLPSSVMDRIIKKGSENPEKDLERIDSEFSRSRSGRRTEEEGWTPCVSSEAGAFLRQL